MRINLLIVSLLSLVLVIAAPVAAQEKKAAEGKGGPPPMLVAAEEVVEGNAEPMQELVGTVFFSRVSHVAAEVEGLVSAVAVEDGDRVKRGAVLVRLQTDILETNISKTRNAHAQAVLDMEQSRKDLQRLESLYAEKLIAETTFDAQSTKTQGLEKQVASLQAELDRLELQKDKMTIRSPFAGLVLKREVEKGEWAKVGSTVASVADDREIDIVVDVPERQIRFLEKGRELSVVSGGNSYTGRYVALVPKGDIATRTFSIKVRMENSGKLIEGMAAKVMIPVSEEQTGLLVPRDAVINKFGRDVVFVVVDGQAKMIPVEVTGYSGLQLGVKGPGLEAGQKVVTKGQERIFRDGTPVRIGS